MSFGVTNPPDDYWESPYQRYRNAVMELLDLPTKIFCERLAYINDCIKDEYNSTNHDKENRRSPADLARDLKNSIEEIEQE